MIHHGLYYLRANLVVDEVIHTFVYKFKNNC